MKEKRFKRVHIFVDEKDWEQWGKLCKFSGKTKSRRIRELIREDIFTLRRNKERIKEMLEIFRELGWKSRGEKLGELKGIMISTEEVR